MGLSKILFLRRMACLQTALLLLFFTPAWAQVAASDPAEVPLNPGSAMNLVAEKPAETALPAMQAYDLETAFSLSARQGKQIIVLAHADWSSHSRKLLEIWQSDPSVREFLVGFVPVILDADKDKEQCLSLNLRAWPTTLVMQRDRSILAELRGVRDPVDYLALLTSKLERYRKP